MYGHKKLYQFGKYIFRRENMSNSISVSAKTQIENSNFGDGGVRVNGIKKDWKGDYILSCDFLSKPNDNLDYFNSFVLNKPEMIFFTSLVKSETGEDIVKVFWNYASYQSFDQKWESETNDEGEKNYSISFRLFYPYFFEITSDVNVIVPNLYKIKKNKWDEAIFDQSYWDDENTEQFVKLSSYSEKQKLEMLGCCETQYRLTFEDRIFNLKRREIRIQNLLLSTNNLDQVWKSSATNSLWDQAIFDQSYWGGLEITSVENRNVSGQNLIVSTIIFSPTAVLSQQINGNYQNQFVTAGVLVKTTGNIKIGIREINNLGNVLANYSQNFTLTGNFEQLLITYQVQNVTAKLEFYIENINSTPKTLEISSPQLVLGQNLVEYNSTPIFGDFDISFVNSTPILYKNIPQTFDLKTSGSVENQIFCQVRIPKMIQNEVLEITNFTNNSGYKITWLSAQTLANAMILNCAKAQLFDVTTGIEILPEDGAVRIEIVGEKQFMLSPNYSPPEEFWEENINKIEVKSNTQTQKILYIKNLNTYH